MMIPRTRMIVRRLILSTRWTKTSFHCQTACSPLLHLTSRLSGTSQEPTHNPERFQMKCKVISMDGLTCPHGASGTISQYEPTITIKVPEYDLLKNLPSSHTSNLRTMF